MTHLKQSNYHPQERMANRLGVLQQTISIHLQKMPELAKLVNTDLSKGFTVSQVAEKHGWTEPKQDMKRIFSWALGVPLNVAACA